MKRIVQITAGRGPEECCFVVAQVLKMMIQECKQHDCSYEVLHRAPSGINGNLFSASICVDTKKHPALFLEWIGTIQWVAQSPFRIHHKRKNWFVGVFEIAQDSMKPLDFSDVSYEAFRSGGPGGQNVNKVSSAIRATHRPSGLSVKVMDSRSQLQNKKLATERLEQLWKSAELEALKKQQEDGWNNHLELQRGNPVRVFKAKDLKVKAEPKKFRNQRSKENLEWKREM